MPPIYMKFGFRIRTRVGLVVDRLSISAPNAAEAEVKLRQIYRDCVILERTGAGNGANAFSAGAASSAEPTAMNNEVSFDDIACLITRPAAVLSSAVPQ